MEYLLSEVLLNKELKKTLSGGSCVLIDESGCFGDEIDFGKKSMRRNHIETFNRLYTLGGDELFERIISKGETALTKDKNAAKGIAEIEGTDKYFLKANASAFTAFSSILSGIMLWAEHILELDETKDLKLVEKEESATEENYENDEELEMENYLIGKNLSIAVKNGKSALYDETEEKFITFETEIDGEKKTVSEFYSIEPLRLSHPSLFEEEEAELISGYKYQLKENGKFGYISRFFTQFTAPVFEDILFARSKHDGFTGVFAWTKSNDGFADEYHIHCSYDVTVSVDDIVLYNDETHLPLSDDEDGAVIVTYDESMLPTTTALFDDYHCYKNDLENEACDEDEILFMFYRPDDDFNGAILKFPDGEQVDVSFANGFIESGDYKSPAQEFNAYSCREFLKSDEADITAEKLIYHLWDNNGIYIVKRDGYYAVANILCNGRILNYSLLTPFAFTDIQCIYSLNNEYFLKVDRFGKKGIFKLSGDNCYIIPCDYEKIELIETEDEAYFSVSKAGFKGEINLFGEWIENLKRS